MEFIVTEADSDRICHSGDIDGSSSILPRLQPLSL
jgi:hypothetical protein